jgi:hypothetical protein
MFDPDSPFPTPPSTPKEHKRKKGYDDPKRLDGIHPLINNPKYLGILKPEGASIDKQGHILIPEVLNR